MSLKIQPRMETSLHFIFLCLTFLKTNRTDEIEALSILQNSLQNVSFNMYSGEPYK